ncbi:MAG: PspC domain-containing protein [Gammaproteobacteria bacterium]
MSATRRIYDADDVLARFRRQHSGAVFMGVCARVADHFDYDRTAVRLVTLLLLYFVTAPTLLLYLLLAWLGDAR